MIEFNRMLNLAGSSDREPQSGQTPKKPNAKDAELLDAYSQAVVSVVESVSPAVICVSGEGRGSGSGFLITPDGYAITNSHVVGGRSHLTAETDEGDQVPAEVIGARGAHPVRDQLDVKRLLLAQICSAI